MKHRVIHTDLSQRHYRYQFDYEFLLTYRCMVKKVIYFFDKNTYVVNEIDYLMRIARILRVF